MYYVIFPRREANSGIVFSDLPESASFISLLTFLPNPFDSVTCAVETASLNSLKINESI
jgi:hypothetical protein